MKKLLTATTMSLFLLFLIPGLCSSAYRIHLKDGREFTTDRYWEDEDQIRFKRFGGEVGIPRNFVREIEEVEGVPKNETAVPKDDPLQVEAAEGKRNKQEAPQEGQEASLSSETETPGRRGEDPGFETADGPIRETKEDTKNETKDEEYYKKKKATLERELRDALEQYKKAKARGQDQEMRSEFRRSSRLSAELEHLGKELAATNDGKFPDWWERPENTE